MHTVTVLKRIRGIKNQLLSLRDGMNTGEYDGSGNVGTGALDFVSDAANLVINAEKAVMQMEAHRAGLVVKACVVRGSRRDG